MSSNKTNNKRFIITDPCYIMDDKQYQAICYFGCDFEGQSFPIVSARQRDGVAIKIHLIDGTPNGDGSTTYKGQMIGVDAGMLCIAEVIEGKNWYTEKWGATFETYKEARAAFRGILKRF